MQVQQPVWVKYGKEIEQLQQTMAAVGRQVCMANPEYRELHGRLQVYLGLERELQKVNVQDPFTPEPVITDVPTPKPVTRTQRKPRTRKEV